MEYCICKLHFITPVRFGVRSLETSDYSFGADTLFSALCCEAVKGEKQELERLYQISSTKEVVFSDVFPFTGDILFVPKPMKRIEAEFKENSSVVKKAYKKLKYVPITELDSYLNGKFDIKKAYDFSEFGSFDMRVHASIRGENETKPYRIKQFSFAEGNGLYFIAGYENDEIKEFIFELMQRLSYTGIGGKRSSGRGKFTFETIKPPLILANRLEKEGKTYMTLSGCLPVEDQIEHAMYGADYLLDKKSGFVYSDTYAPEQTRKKDMYMIKAGAVWKTKFSGAIYDVSSGGNHPVYRYAIPMFLEVDE